MSAQRLWTGVAFIIAGVLFLLNTLGILTWSIWWHLLDLWPVLLISLGLTLLFGRSRLAFIGPLFLAMVVVFIALTPGYFGEPFPAKIERSFVEPMGPGIESGRLELDFGAGIIKLGSGPDLVRGDLNYFGRAPVWDFRQQGSTAIVEVSAVHRIRPHIRFFEEGQYRDYSSIIDLNPTIPWDIDIEVGAADLTADLSEIAVKELNINVGAGKVDLFLGDSGRRSSVRVDSGVAKLYISVPASVGLRVHFSGGINSSNFSEIGLVRRGEVWLSPNWEEAASSYDIRISNGVGKVDLIRIGSRPQI